jgi:hypothetical protein
METRSLRRRETLIWRRAGDGVVILNGEGTQLCRLDQTAAAIWTLADGTKTLKEIADGLCARFEVSPVEALGNVQELTRQLVEAGLAEWGV